tara:strand:- start:61749 stop:62711 length:963 start_codon:yes stop_codon:yes gene_type:complete
MREIKLSINPIYKCNFRCNFCYLTEDQLSSSNCLDLKELQKLLNEVSQYRKITEIDLYGGEIALLSSEYLYNLSEIIYHHYQGDINIITNFSKANSFFNEPFVNLSVSYDHDSRQSHERVLQNIISSNKEISILMLASSEMIQWSGEKLQSVITILSQINNIKSVEIKPYSTNQSNQQKVSFLDFENFVKRWLYHSQSFNFEFINLKKIHQALEKESSSWSDDHVYITPDSKFGILDFDSDNNEEFRELSSFNEYLKWCEEEKRKVMNNNFCSKCRYLGNCLSEHLQEVKSLESSCNGFINLLDDYAKRPQIETNSFSFN